MFWKLALCVFLNFGVLDVICHSDADKACKSRYPSQSSVIQAKTVKITGGCTYSCTKNGVEVDSETHTMAENSTCGNKEESKVCLGGHCETLGDISFCRTKMSSGDVIVTGMACMIFCGMKGNDKKSQEFMRKDNTPCKSSTSRGTCKHGFCKFDKNAENAEPISEPTRKPVKTTKRPPKENTDYDEYNEAPIPAPTRKPVKTTKPPPKENNDYEDDKDEPTRKPVKTTKRPPKENNDYDDYNDDTNAVPVPEPIRKPVKTTKRPPKEKDDYYDYNESDGEDYEDKRDLRKPKKTTPFPRLPKEMSTSNIVDINKLCTQLYRSETVKGYPGNSTKGCMYFCFEESTQLNSVPLWAPNNTPCGGSSNHACNSGFCQNKMYIKLCKYYYRDRIGYRTTVTEFNDLCYFKCEASTDQGDNFKVQLAVTDGKECKTSSQREGICDRGYCK